MCANDLRLGAWTTRRKKGPCSVMETENKALLKQRRHKDLFYAVIEVNN